MPSHMTIISGEFIKIPPVTTEILRHAKQVLTDNGHTQGRPENTMPLTVYC